MCDLQKEKDSISPVQYKREGKGRRQCRTQTGTNTSFGTCINNLTLSLSLHFLSLPPPLLHIPPQLADDELDCSDRELDMDEDLQWADEASLPRPASGSASGVDMAQRAYRSGRDTPASVESIPLEWDHDYDLSRGLESAGGRGLGSERGQGEEREDEYVRTAAVLTGQWREGGRALGGVMWMEGWINKWCHTRWSQKHIYHTCMCHNVTVLQSQWVCPEEYSGVMFRLLNTSGVPMFDCEAFISFFPDIVIPESPEAYIKLTENTLRSSSGRQPA